MLMLSSSGLYRFGSRSSGPVTLLKSIGALILGFAVLELVVHDLATKFSVRLDGRNCMVEAVIERGIMMVVAGRA
jgi:hypothetical protein